MEDISVINRAVQKSFAILSRYNKVMVSISGGSDSDVMMDMILRVCPKDKLNFVFFDTGIEYQATKDHLNYLEEKYDIKIERERASVPVPLGCKRYGLPFLNKFVSQMIERLQNKNFDFKNDSNLSFEELCKKYPNTKGALTWWCNQYPNREGKLSSFNINSIKYLKEFMIENPPTFKISDKCCLGAKKNTSKEYEKHHVLDLKCVGLRKSEGGVRAQSLKNCFEYKANKSIQTFRPIFWFTNKDKIVYDMYYNITHSDCYTKYGMKRTGCAGCPFNSKFDEDLKVVKQFEPKLYKAVNNIFGQSYEYTRKYREYKRIRKLNDRILKGQLSIEDFEND